MRKNLKEFDIKLLILDVDGVFTDGNIYYFDNGVEGKKFHSHDGLGIKLLMRNSINAAVISGMVSVATEKRMRTLGIENVYLGVGEDKIPCFNLIKNQFNLADQHIAYVGDDLPDIPVMERVGFRIAVANAKEPVKAIADYITELKGGEGAVREVCDMLILNRING